MISQFFKTNKRIFVLVFSLIFIGAMTAVWLGRGQDVGSELESNILESSITGTQSDAAVGRSTEKPDQSPDSKTMSRIATPTINVVKPESHSEATQKLLWALEGSVADAIDFNDQYTRCRNNADFIFQAEHQASVLESVSNQLGVRQISKESVDDHLINAERREIECTDFLSSADTGDQFNDGQFLKRTEDAANSGNAIARFLYAMWSPSDKDSFLLGSGFVHEFETRAKEFTEYNKQDDVKLWLLANGLSYSTGDKFTPLRPSLGSAFLIATQLCGLQHAIIDKQLKLNVLIRELTSSEFASVSEAQILEMGVRISNEYCEVLGD